MYNVNRSALELASQSPRELIDDQRIDRMEEGGMKLLGTASGCLECGQLRADDVEETNGVDRIPLEHLRGHSVIAHLEPES